MLTKTRKETTVNILAQMPETFDAILKNCKNYTKEFIQQRLEIFNLDIFSSIDIKRFEVIRIDERTLVTSCVIKQSMYLQQLLQIHTTKLMGI